MEVTQKRVDRNLSMECCKMVAAIMVVFLHAPFPGKLSNYVTALSAFAVPMFFMISGYFNWGGVPSSKILRRLMHILKLYVIANVIHLICLACLTVYRGGSVMDYVYTVLPDRESIPRLLLAQQSLLLAQLWTILSTALCYGVLWVYTRFMGDGEINYHPLYGFGVILACVYFVLAIILPGFGVELPYYTYRNGWFLGLPCFLMGMFLNEYRERIFEVFHLNTKWLICLTLAGMIGCVIQVIFLQMHGTPLGMPLQVVSMMLLMSAHPEIVSPKRRMLYVLVSKLGIISTAVYILHVSVQVVYGAVLQSRVTECAGDWEPWLRPIVILLVSILLAIVWERIDWLLKKKTVK